VTPSDALRPPPPADPTATLAKDWLHLNVLDHDSGIVGVVNTSLHGDRRDPRAVAAGAALFWSPADGWLGDVRTVPLAEAVVGNGHVAFDWLALAVAPRSGAVAASVRMPERIVLSVEAAPLSEPVEVDLRVPFGSGWISWYIVPRLALRGTLSVGGAGGRQDLGAASGYHDHNWGRWRWGEDVGWEWAVCMAPRPGPVFEWSRATNRSHRAGTPSLIVLADGRRRIFRGPAITVTRTGQLGAPDVRLPGALAALHADRRRPRLPRAVRIDMDNGLDRVVLDIELRAAAQVITPEPTGPGASFIHELAGTFRGSARFGRETMESEGLAIFEHAD
jgi:hypothetical protein